MIGTGHLAVLAGVLGMMMTAGAVPLAAQAPPRAQSGAARFTAKPPAPDPVPPSTVSRTSDGAVTVRAVRIDDPLRIDGRLDETYYREIPAISDFVQQEPVEGALETEKTEAWVFFDRDNLYVAARCWDSHPEREIADEMRRDANNILQNESFTVLLDTFFDRRNGVFFQTNPLGAQRDVAVTDEVNVNQDWNTVWDVKTERTDQGWTVEFAIPFKSLRYNSNPKQVWGINFRRVTRWKNEWTYLTPIPAYSSIRGIFLVSLAGTLVGLEMPPGSLNLEVKPYGISGVRTDRAATPSVNNKVDRNVGADAKYGLSKSLTLDLTYNTDFAQVEDDTQQVNLTRFNQFFPERREFFLEGQGIFAFGGANTSGGGNNNTPVLFFSRRVGLNNGRPVPIAGGGRVTGRAGAYSIGLLNIQSEADEPSRSLATNFTVARLKRDVLRRSYVGMLYTRRDETAEAGRPVGETLGADAFYSFSTVLNANAFYARTLSGGAAADGASSYMGRIDYSADRYGLQLEHLLVGEHFSPEVGFLRRADFRRNFAQARFSPRPNRNHWKRIRRFVYTGSLDYTENSHGRLDFREQGGLFELEFFNSDKVTLDVGRVYEYIPKPFAIATGVTVPVDGYQYQNLLVSYLAGTQHTVSGTISYQQGSLYDGTKRTLALSGGRTEVSSQLAFEPGFSLNWVDLPWGAFTNAVITERTTYTISPRMFVSALTQYVSATRTFSTNARFRWEYRPGSEIFVVYSDGRDTRVDGFPKMVNRAFIVKINTLFRL